MSEPTTPSSLLLSMPLHAITERHGESGLRQRFALEIADFEPDQQERLNRALALAAKLHADDRRVGGEPYLNHVLRVALRIASHYRVRDPDVLIAALLHDTAEDHPEELAGGAPSDPTEAALAVLARDFGERVAGLVRSVTNPPEYGPGDRNEQYRQHVAAALERDPWSRVIKVSDFTDNGVGVIYAVGPKVPHAAAKYAPLVPVLRELVARPDTPLDDEVKAHIFDQLDLAVTRFAAILDS